MTLSWLDSADKTQLEPIPYFDLMECAIFVSGIPLCPIGVSPTEPKFSGDSDLGITIQT